MTEKTQKRHPTPTTQWQPNYYATIILHIHKKTLLTILQILTNPTNTYGTIKSAQFQPMEQPFQQDQQLTLGKQTPIQNGFPFFDQFSQIQPQNRSKSASPTTCAKHKYTNSEWIFPFVDRPATMTKVKLKVRVSQTSPRWHNNKINLLTTVNIPSPNQVHPHLQPPNHCDQQHQPRKIQKHQQFIHWWHQCLQWWHPHLLCGNNASKQQTECTQWWHSTGNKTAICLKILIKSQNPQKTHSKNWGKSPLKTITTAM